ncbi:hypothetical protein DMI62_10665 [Escherichia coli]|nr:hypothetical protein [Escherichia coli]
MDELEGHEFDLIINATSSGISGDIQRSRHRSFIEHLLLYDMFYQKGKNSALRHGVSSEAQSVLLMV